MKKRKWGRIINIASAHGLVASAQKVAYVAAKHGLVGMTKVVAMETANAGITCNAICPGWVLTPLVQQQIDDARQGVGQTGARGGQARLLSEKQPMHGIHHAGEASARSPCSWRATRPPPSPARPIPSTAAGRRSDPKFLIRRAFGARQ